MTPKRTAATEEQFDELQVSGRIEYRRSENFKTIALKLFKNNAGHNSVVALDLLKSSIISASTICGKLQIKKEYLEDAFEHKRDIKDHAKSLIAKYLAEVNDKALKGFIKSFADLELATDIFKEKLDCHMLSKPPITKLPLDLRNSLSTNDTHPNPINQMPAHLLSDAHPRQENENSALGKNYVGYHSIYMLSGNRQILKLWILHVQEESENFRAFLRTDTGSGWDGRLEISRSLIAISFKTIFPLFPNAEATQTKWCHFLIQQYDGSHPATVGILCEAPVRAVVARRVLMRPRQTGEEPGELPANDPTCPGFADALDHENRNHNHIKADIEDVHSYLHRLAEQTLV